MPNGYTGSILRVNLTSGTWTTEHPEEIFYRTYLGGRALAAYYLLNDLPAFTDPLGPENELIFAVSVTTGARVPGLSRYTVAAKSPLTGLYGEAEASGYFGAEMKWAGYDAIIFEGCSPDPVYLAIVDGEVELRDAARLWGKDTGDVQAAIWEEMGDRKVQVAQIGPAGENLVRFACVLSGPVFSHVNGRAGMGAVMGSKKLRAVAVRGHQRNAVKDEEALRKLAVWFGQTWKSNPDDRLLREVGTAAYLSALNGAGILPTRNFSEGVFEATDAVSAEAMRRELDAGSEGCYACPVRCKHPVKSDGVYKIDPLYGGPEYESLAAFTSSQGISDVAAAAKANELCNRWGLDTIGAGVTIAFAQECLEKGIISEAEVGAELRFGNAEAMLAILEQIAFRRGFGDILAEGTKRAADKIGKGAEKLAMQVKGQELPLHDPRGKKGVGLGYAVSPTGADHLQIEHDGAFAAPGLFLDKIRPLGINEPVDVLSLGPEKTRLFTYLQIWWSLLNSLDWCFFTVAPVRHFEVEHVAQIVEACTGWNTSIWELMKVGERALTELRLFNLKHGWSRKDDALPDRLYEPLPGGPMEGCRMDREELEAAIDAYHGMMGWDERTGVPTGAKLEELQVCYPGWRPGL